MSSFRPRLRRVFGRLLLLVVPLSVAFVAAELILRATGDTDTEPEESLPTESRWLTVVPSPELGWIFPADTTGVFRSSGRLTPIATNSWGLRSPEVSADTTTRRILMLGDSYTFGWGMVDEAGFVRLVEEGLRRESPQAPIECINGGLPGFSLYQQLRMLEHVRRRTKIHAVVATISLANDPIDEKRIRRFAPDRLMEFSYDLRDSDSVTAKLIAASRLLTLIDERTMQLQFSLINTSGSCRDLAEESLRDLAAACRDANLPLVWVIVPRTQEIRPGRFWRRALNGATDRMRGHFIGLAEELGVPVIDLKPVLIEVQEREDIYLPADAHWNEAGHRAVANEVLEMLMVNWKP
ncbi:MAG: SGNH/GDSL hydrolase family protein [Candidatus Krumholzibacteriota bacterium]